jgi:hypothetical protein
MAGARERWSGTLVLISVEPDKFAAAKADQFARVDGAECAVEQPRPAATESRQAFPDPLRGSPQWMRTKRGGRV